MRWPWLGLPLAGARGQSSVSTRCSRPCLVLPFAGARVGRLGAAQGCPGRDMPGQDEEVEAVRLGRGRQSGQPHRRSSSDRSWRVWWRGKMRSSAMQASGGTGGPRRAARSLTAASSSLHPSPSLPPWRMARGGGRGRRLAGAVVLYQRGRWCRSPASFVVAEDCAKTASPLQVWKMPDGSSDLEERR